jgi:hypothetical protein
MAALLAAMLSVLLMTLWGCGNPFIRDIIPEKSDIAVTGVTLSPSSLTFIIGGADQTLTAAVTPADATNKAVTWISSNPAVAAVTDGVVHAGAVGTATITVTTADGGKTADATVTVTDPAAEAAAFETDSAAALTNETRPVAPGDTADIAAIEAALDAYNTLSAEAKAEVSAATKEALDTLTVKAFSAHYDVILAEIPANVTPGTAVALAADVTTALAAYDKLTTEGKAKPQAILDKAALDVLEAAIVTNLKITLNAEIGTANTAIAGVVPNTASANVPVGTEWVTQTAKDTFDAAITTAQGVYNNASATPAQITTATAALNAAITTFNGAKHNGTLVYNALEVTLTATLGQQIDVRDGSWNLISTFTLSKGLTLDPPTVTLNAPGFSSGEWYLDGDDTAYATGSSLYLDANWFDSQAHSITFVGELNNVPYSIEIPFTVVD